MDYTTADSPLAEMIMSLKLKIRAFHSFRVFMYSYPLRIDLAKRTRQELLKVHNVIRPSLPMKLRFSNNTKGAISIGQNFLFELQEISRDTWNLSERNITQW